MTFYNRMTGCFPRNPTPEDLVAMQEWQQVTSAWLAKSAAEVADDVRAVLAKVPADQDHRFFLLGDFYPAVLLVDPPPKAPPVVAHTPPRLRGRWARG